ncbi:MAG TPA: hypothetical protein VN641_16395 [Urbifossiella sp.]|nr:hypothetical protein [Urbifossiella sp.]
MWREFLTWGGIAIWLASTAIGFGIWQEYEATPGAAPSAASQPLPASDRPHVVVYLHPRCPCSRATLDELAIVLEERRDADVEIVFVRPPDMEAGWERGELWDRAAALPGARVRVDAHGDEAKAAGAATSGTVIYSNEAGRVLFQGGITRGRGAHGDNAGRTALESRLCGRSAGIDKTPIYGCPLAAPDRYSPNSPNSPNSPITR